MWCTQNVLQELDCLRCGCELQWRWSFQVRLLMELFCDPSPWLKSCIVRICFSIQWEGNAWRKSPQISMTCTSNLTKSHFVTHCVHLTGAPVKVGRGAHSLKGNTWCPWLFGVCVQTPEPEMGAHNKDWGRTLSKSAFRENSFFNQEGCRKKSSRPYLGPSEAIFSMDRQIQKITKFCLFSWCGALAAIHPGWGNR